MLTFRFSQPFDVATSGWRSTITSDAIVYRVRVWKADGSGPQPIRRAAGDDTSGILDIGESGDGRRRLDEFAAAALNRRCAPHRAGIEYSTQWGYDFAPLFPVPQLRIDVLEVGTTAESKSLAEAIELYLLECYRRTFKDRPPLNSSAGKAEKVARWFRATHGRHGRVNGWVDLAGLVEHLLLPGGDLTPAV